MFLVGALEDEQVGPQWPALITALQHDKNVYTTMTNGPALTPSGRTRSRGGWSSSTFTLPGRVPSPSPTLDALAPLLYATLTNGAKSAAVPAVRFTTEPSLAAAKAAYSKNDPWVRVLFDNGGGGHGPGALQPTYEAGFHVWPPPGTVVRYNLGRSGTLDSAIAGAASTAAFRPYPAVRPADHLAASANVWAAQPPYDWDSTVPAANGLAFETPAFTRQRRSSVPPA